MRLIRRWLLLFLAAMLMVPVPIALAQEDPFAVFDELFGPEYNAQGALSTGVFDADYAYLVEPLLELIWPAMEIQQEPAGPKTPSKDFVWSALENGNTVSTSIALVPGELLNHQAPDWADFAKNLKLKLSCAAEAEKSFGALEWQQWGISVLTLKGLRDRDTFFAGSNLIGQDVLAVTRQQIQNLMYMGVQAGQKELSESGYYDQTAWFLFSSLRQKDSRFIQALDKFMTAFVQEISGRVESAKKNLQPSNDPNYPSASFVATVDFSNEDLVRMLEKPDMWLAGALVASYNWQRRISPDFSLDQNMEYFESYARRGQTYIVDSIRQASFNGQVRCFLDSQNKPVAAEVTINASPYAFSFTLTKENRDDGVSYNAKFRLEGTETYNPGALYLDMAWEQRYASSITCSARIYMVSGQERQMDLDAGIQYKFDWSGDKAGGTEKERLNVYFQERYSPMTRASLTANATVSPSGIMRQVNLYYNDTYEPLASIALQTEVSPGTALWDSIRNTPESRVVYPVQWSPEEWNSYAQSQAPLVIGQLSQLVPLLPDSIRNELGINFN